MFPIGLVIPIPGIKLGLANIVTIFALFYIDIKSALIISILRCIIAAMLFGGIYSFLFSLSGALISLFVMSILMEGYNRYFSIFGISIGGAAAHNIGQIIVASVLLKSMAVLPYLSLLLFSSLITGALTGYVSGKLIDHFDKIGISKVIKPKSFK
ncbi:MAG: Gx transporter family protein [Clostridiaceae bacterium]|nr:Gx transporter family protein [Clostridiaceae bacterium]